MAAYWRHAVQDRGATLASGIGEPQSYVVFIDEAGGGKKNHLRTEPGKQQLRTFGFSGEVKPTRSVARGSTPR